MSKMMGLLLLVVSGVSGQAVDTWSLLSPTGGSPPDRWGHGMSCMQADRAIYVFDGLGRLFSGRVDLWRYDVSANAWHQMSPVGDQPSGRNAVAASAVQADNAIYLFGGQGSSVVLNDLWRYDASANAWSQLSPTGGQPRGRWGHALSTSEDDRSVWLFGGNSAVGIANPAYGMNDMWQYSVSANAWTLLSPTGGPPCERGQHSMSAMDADRAIYVFGGQDINGTYLNDLWLYDIAANTWALVSPIGPLPTARKSAAMASIQAERALYVFGGGWGGNTDTLSDLWRYAVATNTWTQLLTDGARPSARYFSAMCSLEPSRSLYMFGGTTDSLCCGLQDLWLATASTTTTTPTTTTITTTSTATSTATITVSATTTTLSYTSTPIVTATTHTRIARKSTTSVMSTTVKLGRTSTRRVPTTHRRTTARPTKHVPTTSTAATRRSSTKRMPTTHLRTTTPSTKHALTTTKAAARPTKRASTTTVWTSRTAKHAPRQP